MENPLINIEFNKWSLNFLCLAPIPRIWATQCPTKRWWALCA